MIPPALQQWLYKPNGDGKLRIRCTRYELCVLQRLREQLRSKEVWVVGADRYRNPDEDPHLTLLQSVKSIIKH